MNKRFFFKLFFGPYFAAAFFPVLVYANETFHHGLWPWFGLLCALCAVEMLLGRLGGKRLLPGLLVALGAAACAIFAAPAVGPGPAITAACLVVGGLYALYLAPRTWEQLAAPTYVVPVLAVNLIVAFAMTLAGCHDQVLLGFVAVPFLIAALFLINRRMLTASASMQRGLSPRITQKNVLALLALCAVLLVLINLGALADLVEKALAWAAVLIFKLIDLFSSPGSDSGSGGGEGGGGMDFSGLPVSETSKFWEVLTVIFQYIVLVAVIAGIGFGLYFGIRKLSRFLSGTLRRFVGAYQDGFVDESQALKTAQQMREEIVNQATARLKKLLTPAPNWERLSPVERVRYAYRRARQRAQAVGIDPDPLTPHELLSQPRLTLDGQRDLFEQTYYETRYGGAQPSPDQQANARTVAQTKRK